MFSSSSALSSSASSSSSSTSSTTTKVLSAVQSQSLEEKIPWTSKEEVEKKLASTLTQIQQNQIKRLNLTSASFGRFYKLANALSGNKKEIYSLTVLKNGALASGLGDGSTKLWDLASHTCLSTLQGHTSFVLALTVLPNGRLASGSSDNTIKLWNCTSHSCLSTLHGHARSVSALAVLPNGLLASGAFDNTIKLWDLSSHICLSTLQGHTNTVRALAALPNGLLASGSYDNTIKLWDLASHTCLSTLQGHTSSVFALTALPNGQLASGSSDNTIKLWNCTSHSCLSTLQGHTSSVSALAVLPNGLLASGAFDNTIKLWDLASHTCLSTLQGHTSTVFALTVLPNGLLASGSGAGDKTIKLWEPKTLSAQHLQPILNALKNNTSVIELDLSHNSDIRDDIISPLINIIVKKPGFFSFFSSKPNTTLRTIDLRGTGVSKKGVKKLEKLIQNQRLSIEVLADCPAEWIMIYFLIIFSRANRNSPFVDSGLELGKHSEIGPFLSIPFGFFARSPKNPSSERIAPSPS